MRAKYPPIIIEMKERRQYLEVLEKANQANKEPFYLFIAEHVQTALSQ